VLPSTAAAPGSCISITAQAVLLYDVNSISKAAQLPVQCSASTQACPSAAAAASLASFRVPYSLFFEGLHLSNSSFQQLAVTIQATQKSSVSTNMELRWSRTLSLDISAGSAAAENLDLNMQLAKLYSSAKEQIKQPLTRPSENSTLAAEIVENKECVLSLQKEEDLSSNLRSTGAAAQGLVALLCLSAGIIRGRAFSARISQPEPLERLPKQTCEVACSPFIIDKVKGNGIGAGQSSKKKYKWIRDDDGRLQREDKVRKAQVNAHGGSLDSERGLTEPEEGVQLNIEE
jgi:hypothetical protein